MADYFSNRTEVVHNKHNGYLVRTKSDGADEGGIKMGISALDSAYLVTDWPLKQRHLVCI